MIRKLSFSVLVCVLMLAFSVGVIAEKITVWTWYDGTLGASFKQLLQEDFVAKTGIEVELYTAPVADITTKLLLAVIGGDAPDVVMLYSNQVVELGVRGALHNIVGMPELESTFEIMLPGLMRQLSYKSAIFALPGEVNWTWTYYRTDILQEVGAEVPNTWDEMKSLSTKLKARDMDVYYDYQGMLQPLNWKTSAVCLPEGNRHLHEDGTASNLTDPRVVEGFKELVSLFKDYNGPLRTPVVLRLWTVQRLSRSIKTGTTQFI